MIHFDRFKFKQLKQFVEIAHSGSISRAAENLNTTQPALSRMIKDLEKDLGGAALLMRARKGVSITDNGKRFLEFAEHVLNEFEVMAANLIRDEADDGGSVRIGIGAFEGHTFLQKIMEDVMKRRPEVQFSCMSGKFDDLADPLSSGRLDLIFGPVHSGVLRKGLDAEIVAIAKPVIATRADHPLAQEDDVTVEMLSQQKWLVPVADTLPRKNFDKVFFEAGFTPPTGPVEISPSFPMLAVLFHRNLIGMVPPNLLQQSPENGGLVGLKMKRNPFNWPIQMTTVSGRRTSPALNDTIRAIRKLSKITP